MCHWGQKCSSICQLRYWRLYPAFLRNSHGASLESDIQKQGPPGTGEFSVDSHAKEEVSWVDRLWVASSLCRTRRQARNRFTDPLSFSLQCHACLPPSSLHCVTGRSSFNMFLCVSFTCPDFYFFWQFHSFWSLWASRWGKQKTKTSEHISHLQSSDFSPSPMLKGMLGPVATPLKDQTPCIRWKH